MAAYPKIEKVEATRMAEGSIHVEVVAVVSNNARYDLSETHRVSGDRLIVRVQQKDVSRPGQFTTQTTGREKLALKVWGSEGDIDSVRFVDVYGGDDDPATAKRVVLS